MFVPLLLLPAPQVSVMESGEHVLGAAGEVHLETCVKDLRERFARIELRVGGAGPRLWPRPRFRGRRAAAFICAQAVRRHM